MARHDARRDEPDRGEPGSGLRPALVPAATPQELTTGELIDLVARGDERAYEELYGRVSPTVFGLARTILRDPHQAEEVAQEVLLEVWRTAPRFDATRGSANAWITTMAHRRSVDRVRSSQSARDRDASSAAHNSEIAFDEVSERVETRLEAERVRHCLEGLTPRQRDAVTMAYYQGHSYPQVASLLKLPLGTVKTRMRDGLIRLRDCLGVGSDA